MCFHFHLQPPPCWLVSTLLVLLLMTQDHLFSVFSLFLTLVSVKHHSTVFIHQRDRLLAKKKSKNLGMWAPPSKNMPLHAKATHTPISRSVILDCVPHQNEAGRASRSMFALSMWWKDCYLQRGRNLSKVFRISMQLSSRNGVRRMEKFQRK